MDEKPKKVFSRKLSQEPTEQQRKFLSIPLAVFRDYTNIRALVVENHKQRYHKHPPEFVITKTIEKHHEQMSELDRWNKLGLNKLEYCMPKSDKTDARIYLLSKREQTRIYKNANDHQKQFLFLPKYVFEKTTNIRTIFDKNKYGFVHAHLPKLENWTAEMNNLAFIENNDDNSVKTQSVKNETSTLSAASGSASTSSNLSASPIPIPIPIIIPSTSASKVSTPRELRKRKNNVSIDKETMPLKKEKVDHREEFVMDSSPEPIPAKRCRYRTRSQAKELNKHEHENEHKYEHEVKSSGTSKQSKIPLPEKIRKNNAPEIVSYASSDFEREVKALSFQNFVTKTNILDIIRNEYRDEKKDKNANIPTDEMNDRLVFYFDCRLRTREWHKNGLKQLKFVDCECKRKSTEQTKECHVEMTTTTNEKAKRFEVTEPDSSHRSPSKHQDNVSEPSDFQKEIMAMDIETFVNQTNANDLVFQYLEEQSESNEISNEEMDFALNRFHSLSKRSDKWHNSSLKYLKFKMCECRRMKTFVDKSTQTDSIKTQNTNTQCNPMDFVINELIKHNEQKQQARKSRKSKMTLLTPHSIEESEIIHVASIHWAPEFNEENDLEIADDADANDSNLLPSSKSTAGFVQKIAPYQKKYLVQKDPSEAQVALENTDDGDIVIACEPEEKLLSVAGRTNTVYSIEDERNKPLQEANLQVKLAKRVSTSTTPHAEVEIMHSKSSQNKMAVGEKQCEPSSQPKTLIVTDSTKSIEQYVPTTVKGILAKGLFSKDPPKAQEKGVAKVPNKAQVALEKSSDKVFKQAERADLQVKSAKSTSNAAVHQLELKKSHVTSSQIEVATDQEAPGFKKPSQPKKSITRNSTPKSAEKFVPNKDDDKLETSPQGAASRNTTGESLMVPFDQQRNSTPISFAVDESNANALKPIHHVMDESTSIGRQLNLNFNETPPIDRIKAETTLSNQITPFASTTDNPQQKWTAAGDIKYTDSKKNVTIEPEQLLASSRQETSASISDDISIVLEKSSAVTISDDSLQISNVEPRQNSTQIINSQSETKEMTQTTFSNVKDIGKENERPKPVQNQAPNQPQPTPQQGPLPVGRNDMARILTDALRANNPSGRVSESVFNAGLGLLEYFRNIPHRRSN